MTIAILMLLMVVLAGSMQFADGPIGGGDAGGVSDAGGADAAGDGGEDSGDESIFSGDDGGIVAIADEALREVGSESGDEPPAEGEEADAVTASGERPPMPLAEVGERLGLDTTRLANLPPEAQQQVSEFLQKWYAENYEPHVQQVAAIAEEVDADYAAQSEWYAQVQAFASTPAFKWADYLARNPQQMARVREFLQSGGRAAAQQQPLQALPNIDVNELDESSRKVYTVAQTAIARAERAEAVLRQMSQSSQQTAAQVRAIQQQMQQQQQREYAARQQEAGERASSLIDESLSGAAKQLGFDPRSYPRQYDEAIEHAIQLVAGHRTRHGSLPDPAAVRKYIDLGLRHAGFDEIKTRIAKQRGTSTRPPLGRRADGASRPQSLEELADEAISAVGRQR